MLGGVVGTLMLACSPSSTSPDPGPGTVDSGRLPAPYYVPGRPCEVVIDTPELLASPHVPEGTVVTYNSNPPSSGPHYPVWANFQEFATPLEDGYLVHSLEHGAVALLYAGPSSSTSVLNAEDMDALRKIRDSLPTDPACDPATRVRVVIAPSRKLDVAVAAAAWGWTYRAKCVDVPTLSQFVKDHYAHSPENICAEGRTF